MRLRSRLLLTAVISALISAPTILSAQTTGWNTPTATETVVGDETTRIEGVSYSNWTWVDPTGVSHSFLGTTVDEMKYIMHIDLSRSNGMPLVTSLLNKQASDGTPFFLNATGSIGAVSSGPITLTTPHAVLGVLYAPPGAKGLASYSSTNSSGSSLTTAHTFSDTVELKIEGGINLIIANATGTGTWTFGQSKTNTKATSVTTSSTLVDGVTGNADGINHDYDQIIVWLNPLITNNVFGKLGVKTILQSFSPNTDYAAYENLHGQVLSANQMNLVYVKVGELRNAIWLLDPLASPPNTDPSKGPGFPMAANVATELKKVWASSTYNKDESLNINDLKDILARDPFWDPNNRPTVAAINAQIGLDGINPQNRFVQVYSMPYVANNNPSYTDTWSSSTQYTSNVEDKYTMKLEVHGGTDCIIKSGVNISNTTTISQSVQSAATSTISHSTTGSLQGPSITWPGTYANIYVYRDTLYETYLFVPAY